MELEGGRGWCTTTTSPVQLSMSFGGSQAQEQQRNLLAENNKSEHSTGPLALECQPINRLQPWSSAAGAKGETKKTLLLTSSCPRLTSHHCSTCGN